MYPASFVGSDGARMVFFRPVGLRRAGELVLSDLGDPEGLVLATSSSDAKLSTWSGQPLFLPDGSRILFLRLHDEGPASMSVWTVRTDGSDLRLLATEEGVIFKTVWDPSSRLIAYQTSYRDRETSLRIVVVEDGTEHEIESFTELNEPELMAWSPDGAGLGVTHIEGRTEFWVARDVLGETGR